VGTYTIAGIWRYPVKSMLGERMESATLGERGVAGDRGWAVIDADDGKTASAKHPAKWGRLLHVRARYLEEPAVELTFPDGTTVTTGDADVDQRLSDYLGRPVRLANTPPEGSQFEEVWPTDIEGLAPEAVIQATTASMTPDGEPISAFPISMDAPPGTFFDVTTLHVITTAALAALRAAAPDADFDVRRYRPNLLLESDEVGFVENDWVGHTLAIGSEARARVDLPTMRCVMTTLGQGDIGPDRSTLRTIAAVNRVELQGGGVWACAGAYATVTDGGRLRVGDQVTVQ